MLNKIEVFFKLLSENIAREVNRASFLKITLSGIFIGLVGIVNKPIFALAAPGSWAEVCELTSTSCHPPHGVYCNTTCTNGWYNSSIKCPFNFKPSFAWGYPKTGCWCINRGTVMCCDCTRTVNNAYQVNWDDCGCKHYVS